jgi:hypothetical protein
VILDAVSRLEADPHQNDLERGWAAEVADPAWMLGRQWQLGEHHGEDASSPISAQLAARATPIDPVAGQPQLDPRTVPAEAIVESEPGDWWTAGRRVRIGRRVEAAAAAAGTPLPADDTLSLHGLPVPYHVLDGSGPDGRELWRRRAEPELQLQEAWFGTTAPPDEPVDLWDPAELSYTARFRSGDAELVVERHDGGDLDWFSADATAEVGSAGDLVETVVLPSRLRYPAAPLPRWWQIEDAQVAIGGHAPDRASLATLVLIDLIVNHSDDWFTFPFEASTGEVLALETVSVLDSFGQAWPLTPPADWSLFRTHGFDARSLVIWATAATPLSGPLLDEVVIGIDEDANLVWAVELAIAGRTLATPAAPAPAAVQRDADDRDAFAYLAMTPVPAHWHPYVVEDVDGRRRFVQGRAADLSGPTAVMMPPPESDLLYDPASGGHHPVHQLEPAAVPQDGLRIERRAMLARATSGDPVLWTQRRRQPLLTPPTLGIRFDVLQPEGAPAANSTG